MPLSGARKSGGVSKFGAQFSSVESEATSPLFLWSNDDVVLLGDYRDGRWTISRGWLGAGTMSDVRRWTFAAPSAFAGQVRRLVLEATDNSQHAREIGTAALGWAQQHTELTIA